MARYIVALGALALFAMVATALPVEEDENLDFSGLIDTEISNFEGLEVENQRGVMQFVKDKFLKGLKQYVKEEFISRIKAGCVFEVPTKCGFNILKVKEYYTCAGKYFKDNKEQCLKPKV